MSSHWIDDHGAHLLVGGEVATASQLRVASHGNVTAAPEQLAHESQVLTPTDASRLYLRSGAALAAEMAGVALRNEVGRNGGIREAACLTLHNSAGWRKDGDAGERA